MQKKMSTSGAVYQGSLPVQNSPQSIAPPQCVIQHSFGNSIFCLIDLILNIQLNFYYLCKIKMKASQLLILLALTILMFLGCEKKITNTTNNCPLITFPDLDTFLIQNFLFNPGSYWIYFDSLNNT